MWFPVLVSLWISIHHINLKIDKKKILKNIKKEIFSLKNKTKDTILLKEEIETKNGHMDWFNKKNKFIGNLSF